jgi:hypothetical protein
MDRTLDKGFICIDYIAKQSGIDQVLAQPLPRLVDIWRRVNTVGQASTPKAFLESDDKHLRVLA